MTQNYVGLGAVSCHDRHDRILVQDFEPPACHEELETVFQVIVEDLRDQVLEHGRCASGLVRRRSARTHASSVRNNPASLSSSSSDLISCTRSLWTSRRVLPRL